MFDRPLRFCLISTFYPPYNFGGDGIYVYRLAHILGRRGHQVEVIHCQDAYRLLARQEPQEAWENHPNVKVHGLQSPFGFLSPLATQQTGFPLFKSGRIREILSRGFDVIHYHNISLVGGPKILEYGQGIKLYTIHDFWLLCPTHVLFKFNRIPCEDSSPPCLACTLWHRRPPQWWRYSGLLQRALRQVDAFIAPNPFCQDQHLRRGVAGRFVFLPYFVPEAEAELPSVEEVLGEPAPEKPYFFFMGRLEKLKGLQTLISVFRDYPRARLLVAGTGDYEPQLRRLAGESPNIAFLGHHSDRQLQSLCRGAVALIVPSLFYELGPLVTFEALRLKTPILGSNKGGLEDIIKQSGGGLLFDTQEELVGLLDRLLADPALRNELGRRGYGTYKSKWTPEAHLARYLDLIREIAAKRANQAAASTPDPKRSLKPGQ